MIQSIELNNFRKFETHKISFRPTTVMVGKNNAGKSTVVEAIRLTSLAANRYRALRFVSPPRWLEDPAAPVGVVPSLRDVNSNLRTVFHSYNEPPARVSTTFASGERIDLYVGPDEQVFAVIRDPKGRPTSSKGQAAWVGIEGIAVQPHVAAVQESERVLDQRTVRNGMDSALAPMHFRNQLHLLGAPIFRRFVQLTEETWPSLQIRELVLPDDPREPLRLFVRDGKHVGELATMGHGLQMWLQVMWFLARNEAAPTIVLDEPDVYMHADLQRKLMRVLRRRSQQVIVATHSLEILDEVSPESVLVISADTRASRWATSVSGVQKVVSNFGSVHNIQLSRLAQARRCLFVEGDELPLLKAFWDTLFPGADSLAVLPNMNVGGWTGWAKVEGTAQFLRNMAGDAVVPYALFDSDAHTPVEVAARYARATETNVRLHVLLRKEIENYLISPAAIARLVRRRARRGAASVDEHEISRRLSAICVALLDEAEEDLTNIYQETVRPRVSPGRAARWARKYRDMRCAEDDGAFGLVSGKVAMHRIIDEVKSSYGASLTNLSVAQEMTADEIPREITDFLSAIRRVAELPSAYLALWQERADMRP